MFMVQFHTKFHIRSFSSSLVIAMKLRAWTKSQGCLIVYIPTKIVP